MTPEKAEAADGESTETWAFREPGFFGSVKQLSCCGRCGEDLWKRNKKVAPNAPRHVFGMFKPTMHFVCDPCFDELPS